MIKQDENKAYSSWMFILHCSSSLIGHTGSLLKNNWNNCNNCLNSLSLGSKPLLNHVTLDMLHPPNNLLIRISETVFIFRFLRFRSVFLWPPNQTRFISKRNAFHWVWLQLRAPTVANQTVTIISRELIKNKSVLVAKWNDLQIGTLQTGSCALEPAHHAHTHTS